MQEANVAVPLLRPDQSAPKSGAPIGRLRRLLNGIVRKHGPEGDGRIKVEKRGGFPALSRNVSNILDGSSFGAVGTPGTTLMATLGDELVQIASSSPYVYAPSGPRYEKFDDVVMTETAHRHIVQAGTDSISIPSGARVGTVACYVWSAAGKCYAEFVDLQTDTPIRAPFQIAAAGRVKVKADGTRFWICTDAGGTTVTVTAYNTAGGSLGSATLSTIPSSAHPWDITAMPGTGNGIVIAHNASVGVDYVRMAFATFPAGSIVITGPVFNTHLPATFGVAWLRNDVDPTHLYLATSAQFSYNPGGGDPIRAPGVYACKMTLAGANVSIYIHDATMTQDQVKQIGALTGYVDNVLGTFVSWTTWERNGPSGKGRAMNSTVTTKRADPEPSPSVLYAVQRSVSLAGEVFVLSGRYVIPCYYASVSQEGAVLGKAVPVAQPTYFLIDVARQKLVGELEFGTASFDWPYVGWSPANQVSASAYWLPAPFADADGIVHLPFGYAADVETVQVTDPDLGSTANKGVPEVGMLDIRLGGRGVAVEFADELFIPGPRPVAFARDAFTAAGFELGAEAPTVTGVNDAAGVMAAGQTHRYAIVYSAIDSRGNRIRSIASIATNPVQLTGGQNAMQLQIPTLRQTTYPRVLIEVYRDYRYTDVGTGVIQTSNQLRKITVDEQSPGDIRTPIYNDPTVDKITWIDTVSDAAAAIGAPIYTDDGTLDFMGPPPFSCGCVFGDRVFLGGYDNRVYYSFSKVPGQAIAFNQDAMFITLPTREKVTLIKPIDNRLFFFCESSRIFYVDGGNFLSADGLSGSNPTPVELQFRDGCTGRGVAVTAGIMYESNTGGIWLMTRGLEKVFIGNNVEDETDGATVLDIAVDKDQNVGFLLGSKLVVYDQVHGVWSPWSLPVAGVALCAWQGRFTWADNEASQRTYKHDPTVFSDNGAPIQTRADLLPISTADVHGFQVLWEMAALGEWKGAHTWNVDLTYDNSDVVLETFSEAFPTALDPFRFDWQPAKPECSSVGLSVYDTFPDGVPSQGFTLESLDLFVGVERGKKYNETRIAPTG